jgi:hypothetical protein
VFNPREYAAQRAGFVGELFARNIAIGLDRVLPSADELVHACLAAIPVSIDDARTMGDWRQADLDVIRRLRHAKNLITAAEVHAARLRDQTIAAALTQWISIKPGLP